MRETEAGPQREGDTQKLSNNEEEEESKPAASRLHPQGFLRARGSELSPTWHSALNTQATIPQQTRNKPAGAFVTSLLVLTPPVQLVPRSGSELSFCACLGQSGC